MGQREGGPVGAAAWEGEESSGSHPIPDPGCYNLLGLVSAVWQVQVRSALPGCLWLIAGQGLECS